MTTLIILTSHDTLGNTGRKTGVWVEEFLVPYYAFIDAGLPVRLASPHGGPVPLDPLSIEAIKDTDLLNRFRADESLQEALASTELLVDVDPATIEAVVYPGGHGPLYDLRENEASVHIIESLATSSKPVAAICHSGCVLLEAKTASGEPLVRGRKVTAFSNSEEAAVQLEKAVPYLVESELKRLGAVYSKASDWQEHLVVDSLLITGQNPASSGAVAKAVIEVLKAKSTAVA
ncbi:type 1 glutamine amidotransferase domain-containing protein [Burkholderia sp. 22313]|uniref:type 1 glutamine amidotransferase domain-containing protein n=1 Tax=Burkholderia sp. 22313 TaxID=3453908 RepID=UPI003F863F25